MKKSELYKLVKQSLKEVIQEQTPVATKPTKSTIVKEEWRPVPRPNIVTPIKKPKPTLKKLNEIFPSSFSALNFDECDDFVQYPDLEIFSGDCGSGGGSISNSIDDAWICCSSGMMMMVRILGIR